MRHLGGDLRGGGGGEEEHGEEEHAEILEALLEFVRVEGTDSEDYDEALEELATVVNHHSNEEEQTILDPARTEVSQEVREQLGLKFLELRGKHLDENAGRVENVRRIVAEAKKAGLLDEDDDEDED